MPHDCIIQVREVVTRSLFAPTGPALILRLPDVLSHRLVVSRLIGFVGRAVPPSLGVAVVQKGVLGAEARVACEHHSQLKDRIPSWWLRQLRTGCRSAERGKATTLARCVFAVSAVHFVVHEQMVYLLCLKLDYL